MQSTNHPVEELSGTRAYLVDELRVRLEEARIEIRNERGALELAYGPEGAREAENCLAEWAVELDRLRGEGDRSVSENIIVPRWPTRIVE